MPHDSASFLTSLSSAVIDATQAECDVPRPELPSAQIGDDGRDRKRTGRDEKGGVQIHDFACKDEAPAHATGGSSQPCTKSHGAGRRPRHNRPQAHRRLKLTAAFCCLNAYMYSGKGCCGWSDKSVCLCCENKSSSKMVECTTCCKAKGQHCCLVSSGAIPCDAEVPCQVAYFGFACYPKCGCYLTQAELSGTHVLAPAATPITSASTSAPTAPVAMEREDGLDTTNLKLTAAFCCYNAYIYCGKGCCGASSKSVCLCCENKSSCKMVECTTCCKSKGQTFCLVSSGAFPSDAEVPCQLALFGLACYPKCGCCLTQAELSGTYAIAATTPASQKEPLLDAKKDDAEADDDAEAED